MSAVTTLPAVTRRTPRARSRTQAVHCNISKRGPPRTIAAAPAVSNPTPATGAAANPVDQGISNLASSLDFLSWFTSPHNWLRVVYGATGVGLVFLGLSIMFRPEISQITGAAATTVATVAP